MVAWLRDHAVAHSRDPKFLAAALKVHCRTSSIEPPTPDRIERIVRAATHAYEERFCQRIRHRLTPSTRARLEALLQPADPESKVEEAVELSPSASAAINLLRDERPSQRQKPAPGNDPPVTPTELPCLRIACTEDRRMAKIAN
jgi:hypothetical protein